MTVEIDGANNIVKTNTISEVTSANGVTVDGLNIKDSKLVTADSVITTNITDANITSAKINNDLISGKTALASEPADTDEFLVSDGGTLKRIDYSLIKGSGKVAQVVQAICAGGDTSTTSSSDQSSNVAVAITPSASNSKVLIHMTFGGSSGADYNKTLRWRLYRGSTALGNNTSLGNYNGTDDGIRTHNMSLTFLDSPSTTNATTYTLKFACSQNDSTVSIYASGESQAYAQAMEVLA